MFDSLKGDPEFEALALMPMECVFLGARARCWCSLNGFFVATEFAIVKVRPTRLRRWSRRASPGAADALQMVEQLDAYLSATQFGITLASLGLGWVGEPAFAHLLEPLCCSASCPAGPTRTRSRTPSRWRSPSRIITFLHIVVGELAPKSLAIQQAEATTLARRAGRCGSSTSLFFPGIWLLNGMARRLLQAVRAGRRPARRTRRTARTSCGSSSPARREAGAITASRAELLERALAMMEKTARQVLVPRNQVRFLDLEEPLEKNIAEARAAGHTWLPVCRGNLDQVEGVVNVKDLFFLLSQGELQVARQVQRPVLFVPENVTLEQLLTEFRRRKRQMAMVVDEHGGTSGIVTLADVVAELVGDVAELGRKVEEVRALPGRPARAAGHRAARRPRGPAGREVRRRDEEGEVTTIAGYLMAKLGRVPEKGDSLKLGRCGASTWRRWTGRGWCA